MSKRLIRVKGRELKRDRKCYEPRHSKNMGCFETNMLVSDILNKAKGGLYRGCMAKMPGAKKSTR